MWINLFQFMCEQISSFAPLVVSNMSYNSKLLLSYMRCGCHLILSTKLRQLLIDMHWVERFYKNEKTKLITVLFFIKLSNQEIKKWKTFIKCDFLHLILKFKTFMKNKLKILIKFLMTNNWKNHIYELFTLSIHSWDELMIIFKNI